MAWRTLFVANVNFNDGGRLEADANEFEYSLVWNAENRHRLVIPKLTVSPVFIEREFSF